MMRSPNWWDSGELTADWGGLRNTLYDDGVTIFANYTNNIAGNPVGGKSAGFTYCDNITFGLDLDLEKIIGWKGGHLTVSGLNRDGSNLSQKNIGNQFTVQQVFGGSAVMFYALYLDQKLWDDRISIKIGRFATGDDFASSPIYWLYMNNGIDGNPQALPVNTQFSAYPWAVWAARVRVEPTPEFNGMIGVYQVSNRIFDRSYHGLDWSMRSNDSILLISQIGWTPQFFKRPVPAETKPAPAGEAKSIVATKSAKEVTPPSDLKGLPGHYWVGAYWSPWEFPQFGTTATATNSYGFYWHADQMIFQEAPGSDQGLSLWSAFVLSPQQNIAKLPFQVNGGLIYRGLMPNRDDDYACFGCGLWQIQPQLRPNGRRRRRGLSRLRTRLRMELQDPADQVRFRSTRSPMGDQSRRNQSHPQRPRSRCPDGRGILNLSLAYPKLMISRRRGHLYRAYCARTTVVKK